MCFDFTDWSASTEHLQAHPSICDESLHLFEDSLLALEIAGFEILKVLVDSLCVLDGKVDCLLELCSCHFHCFGGPQTKFFFNGEATFLYTN